VVPILPTDREIAARQGQVPGWEQSWMRTLRKAEAVRALGAKLPPELLLQLEETLNRTERELDTVLSEAGKG